MNDIEQRVSLLEKHVPYLHGEAFAFRTALLSYMSFLREIPGIRDTIVADLEKSFALLNAEGRNQAYVDGFSEGMQLILSELAPGQDRGPS